MRAEGKYILGTVREIAKYILQNILEEKEPNIKAKFIDCDFSIIDDYEKENDLKNIAFNVNGWYGIKKLTTGFDNGDGLDIFADYYGGGNGVYEQIFFGSSKNDCMEIVEEVILKTLRYANNCDENTLLIAEKRS